MLHNSGIKRLKRFAVKKTPAVKSAEVLQEERRNAWLLGRAVIPVSTPLTQAARRCSPQTSNAVEPTSSQTKNSQQEASQLTPVSDGESAVLRVPVLTVPQKRRPPRTEMQAK